MTTNPPPITQPVINNDGLPTLPWTLFFNQTYNGDSGNEWTPEFVNLSGTFTATGRFYRISQYLSFFTVNIEPDTATSATAGSTYIEGFPLNFTNDSFNTVVSGTTGGNIGMNVSSTNRIYVPEWTSISTPLTVLGFGEAV